MKDGTKALCVYAGHNFGHNPNFAVDAEKLGHLMAESRIRLVYGAGNVGLMGAVSQAVLCRGGRAVGVTTPHIMAKQEPSQEGIVLEVKDNLLDRKARLIELSDAFCILPGGMGTLNEVSDVLVMHQIGETNLPVYFLNTDGYWNMFGTMIKEMIKDGFVKDQTEYNIHIYNSPEELINAYNARFFI
ncbi:MAG: TIGR00730 family Rossman fold protein [Rickettsiales bacterium]|jgi:uncharacterized protein (TIGR00730 family)|nr:TIGR00730 family Rossman fold protein [Rickettsiales bacterium]